MKLRENIAGSLILAILTILVLLPLLTVLIQVVCPGLSLEELNLGNLNLVLDVFVRPLWRRAFINSASMSLCTTIAGLILAGFLAQIRVKYNFPLAKLLDIVSWILMIMPSFILAQGWVFFASGNGISRSWLHIEGMNNFLFSFPGLVTVMVLCKYPMAYVAIKSALEWYPARLVHAARLNGASPFKAWTSVQLPLCMPAYFSAAMLIFMDTVGDYGMSSTITAVYSFPTLPYTIYSAICSSPVRFDMAGVLSLYLVVMIVIAMILQFYMMGRKRFDYLDSGTEQVVPKKVSRSASALLSAVSGIFSLVALGIPIGSSFIMSFSNSFSIERFAFTLDNYKNVLQPDGALLEGIRNSLSLAAVAAVVGLILGFAVAYTLTYSQFKLKRLIDMLTLVAMAVPGVVLGCFLANLIGTLLGTTMAVDIFFGTLATLLAALLTRCLANVRIARLALPGMIPPVLCNALIVGAELTALYSNTFTAGLFAFNAFTVGVGELAACLLGVLLVWVIERNPALKKAFTS